MITQLFELVLIPAIALFTIFLVNLINTKTKEIKRKTNNELIKDAIDQTSKIIIDCIQTTNQTYVNILKQKGEFNKDAQKEAFQKTYNAVLAVLTEDTKELLSSVIGDLGVYITAEIEATILKTK